MRLFIAEKPELAKAIAEGLDGSFIKEKTHIIKGDDIITWAYGHILELAEPENYDEKYKKWGFENLPIFPSYFKYIPKESSKSQLNAIVKLINDNRVDSIVNCGDADEEGQILIDEIINYSKTNKKIFRVLINDITPKAVREEIAKIKPNSDFKGMSESGFARSQADWLVGMNITRAFTLQAQKNGYMGKVISIGRVQTPILGLITARDYEFENFKSKDYFVLLGDFKINNDSIKAILKTKDKIEILDLANTIKNNCIGKDAKVNIKKENKKEYPPLPYNLLILQAECAKKFGFSPDKTLKITQELRETHKAISYNRSDCQYLPENIFHQASSILEAINNNSDTLELKKLKDNANLDIKSKAFDDTKLSAHYGIIPTQMNIKSNFTNEQKLIYDLIAKRFLLQFFDPREYLSISIELNINEYIFNANQSITTKKGFREFLEKDENKDEEKEEIINYCDFSKFNNNDLANCININIDKKQTKPKPYYTMETLLKDLNSVAKYVKDERIKKLLLEKDKDKKGESGGIGTPATRSNHIQTLIDREYIEVSKDKKQIIKSTQKGKELIKYLPQMLSSPDMTALWYEQQKIIEEGKLDRNVFLNEIKVFIENEINNIKNTTISIKSPSNKTITNIICPKCNIGVLREINGKFGKFFSCTEYSKGCDYKAKSINGKPEIKSIEANKNEKLSCPKCNDGFLLRRESKNKKGVFWYGCSQWKNGCNFTCLEKDGRPSL
ncbi:DNA topoisomerase III [Campylobacter jejuni]|nr:DNA topoisomerase III [Campylobacter jejuni]